MTKTTVNTQSYYVINEAVTMGCWEYLFTEEAKENEYKKKYTDFNHVLLAFDEKEFTKKSEATKYLKELNVEKKKNHKLEPYKAELKDKTYIIDKEEIGYKVVNGQYLVALYKGLGFEAGY